MRLLPRRFTTRLLLGYIGVVLLVAIGLGLYTNHNLRARTTQDLIELLNTQCKLLVESYGAQWFGMKDRDQVQRSVCELAPSVKGRITVVDREGLVLGDSEQDWAGLLAMENHRYRPEIRQAFEAGSGQAIRYSQTLKTQMLYLARRVELGGATIGAVRLALPLQAVGAAISENLRGMLIAGVVGVGLAIGLGVLVIRSLSRPLRSLSFEASRLAQNLPGITTPKIAKDELDRLAQVLSLLSGSLAQKISELKRERHNLSAILAGMEEGVIALDRTSRIQFLNPAAGKFLHIAEPSGRRLLEASRHYELYEIFDSVINKESSVQKELELRDPEYRVFRVSGVPLKVEGMVKGVVIVLFDITRLKELERMRKDFVANVSHELKTPITAITGSIETLRGIEDPRLSEKFLDIVARNTQRLNALIDDLLKLSKIESEAVLYNFKPVRIKDSLDRVLSSLGAALKKKDQTFCSELPSDLPLVRADPDYLDQVLLNLLDNAIKFTPERGVIKVRARLEGEMVCVEIEDTGIGIPAQSLPRIFERFYRVDASRSRDLGGTGLGLSIVKHIVEAHQGRVWAESTLGQGSTFYFTLPKG